MINDLMIDPDFQTSMVIFGLVIVLFILSRIDAYRMDKEYKRLLQQCKYGEVKCGSVINVHKT